MIRFEPIALLVSAVTISLAGFGPTNMVSSARAAEEEKAELAGTVEEKWSGRPLEDAWVEIDGMDLDERTDSKGRFRIRSVPPGKYLVRVSIGGYREYTKKVTLAPGKTRELTIRLEPEAAVTLEEITVRGEEFKPPPKEVSQRVIEFEEITTLPGAGGDVLRVLESMPGVGRQPMGGGYPGLIVRGSSPEDSIIFLNRHFVPLLYHFGGLISTFNSDLVDEINFYAGGYDIKYNDAMGGIIDVVARPPRFDRWGGYVDTNFIYAGALAEGPLSDKSAMYVAARRSTFDFIIPYVIPDDAGISFTVVPRFFDYQTSYVHLLDDRHTISVLLFGSDDKMEMFTETSGENEPDLHGNFFMSLYFHEGSVKWEWEPSPRLKNDFSVFLIYLYQRILLGEDIYVNTKILPAGFTDDIRYSLGDSHTLRAGVFAVNVNFAFDLNIIRPPKEGDPYVSFANEEKIEAHVDNSSQGTGFYLADDIQPAEGLLITPGVHVAYNHYMEDVYADMRLYTRYEFVPTYSVKAAVGTFHQPPQGDELIPPFGNRDLAVERAIHYILGFEHEVQQGLDLDVQAYYKQMDDLVVRAGESLDSPYTNQGKGFVYGAEVLLKYKLGDRIFSWFAYSYAISKRKDRPDEDWRLFDGDMPHNFVGVFSFRFAKTWRLGFRWQYTSGLPYTPVLDSVYNADNNTYIPVMGPVNTERNPSFHQMDVRIDKEWRFRTWDLSVYLDVQNAYLQQNALGYDYSFDFTEKEEITQIPIIPSIGFKAAF